MLLTEKPRDSRDSEWTIFNNPFTVTLLQLGMLTSRRRIFVAIVSHVASVMDMCLRPKLSMVGIRDRYPMPLSVTSAQSVKTTQLIGTQRDLAQSIIGENEKENVVIGTEVVADATHGAVAARYRELIPGRELQQSFQLRL